MGKHEILKSKITVTGSSTKDTDCRQFLDAIDSVGIIFLDSQGLISQWNTGAQHIYGFNSTEAVGKPFAMLYTQAHAKQVNLSDHLTRAAQNDRFESNELQVRKDGTEFSAHVCTTAVRDPLGEVCGFSVVVRDVSHESTLEVPRLEEAHALLAEDNRRLKLATSTAGIGIWIWDAATNALIWDECMHEIYATPPGKRDNLTYDSWAGCLHPEDRQAAETELQAALERSEQFVSSFRILLSSGQIKHVRAHGAPEKDKDGNLIRFIGINEDITENRQLSINLQKANERFDLAASGASSGIWDWADLTVDRSYWSPKFYELLGYRPNEVEASVASFQKELLHPDDLPASVEAGDALIGEDKPFDIEYRLKHKNGSYRWFRATAIVARDAAGKPTRMVGSIQDIHDKKEYEQLLKTSNDELQQFAYICSHDLKTPLRGIKTYCEILEEDFADTQSAEEKDTIRKITRQADRMDHFISDLLTFSQVGRIGLAGTQVDIHELVKEMILDFHPAFADQNVDIAIEGHLPTVFADRTRVGEIFKNLVENGIKYNESSSKTIRIGCEPGDIPIFYVKDNGIGIPNEHMDSVFRMFRRLHRQEEFGGGTGAGLSIVKKIVDRHQGHIWIEKNEPTGTLFKFTLNLKSPEDG